MESPSIYLRFTYSNSWCFCTKKGNGNWNISTYSIIHNISISIIIPQILCPEPYLDGTPTHLLKRRRWQIDIWAKYVSSSSILFFRYYSGQNFRSTQKWNIVFEKLKAGSSSEAALERAEHGFISLDIRVPCGLGLWRNKTFRDICHIWWTKSLCWTLWQPFDQAGSYCHLSCKFSWIGCQY